jgi:phosphoribosylanthranilate isomerase
MIPVKICGITSLENACMAVNYGASAIGMVFYKGSPRYIHPHQVVEWIQRVPDQVKKVGVFVNENIEMIKSTIIKLNLDYVQLHGNESPEFCEEIFKPIIKVLNVDNHVHYSVLEGYNVYAFLFDTYKKDKPGGTGENFNWEFVSSLKTDTPIILSGGLNADNIIQGIDVVHPAAVDLSSGVESSPGQKDKNKMKQLFKILKDTNSNSNLFNDSIFGESDGL